MKPMKLFEPRGKLLNFGCGDIVKTGWDNWDIQKAFFVKQVDFNQFPYPSKDGTYNYILCDNVLEHLEEPDVVINELWRITEHEGWINIIVPHYSNKGAYSDLQHKHFFNEVAFQQLTEMRTKINKTQKFSKIKITLTPTKVGRFIPKYIREKLSLFIGGLISQIDVELQVKKEEKGE